MTKEYTIPKWQLCINFQTWPQVTPSYLTTQMLDGYLETPLEDYWLKTKPSDIKSSKLIQLLPFKINS